MVATWHAGDSMIPKDGTAADRYWLQTALGPRRERAAAGGRRAGFRSMRPVYQHPALNLTTGRRWDDALGWLLGASVDVAQRFRLDDVMSCSADRVAVISDL